jgi:Spy/CpxP family protein refolding chaperone
MSDKADNQGEGNQEADRQYRESAREFVESGKVDDAAADAATMSSEELEQARRAEAEARSRAKK